MKCQNGSLFVSTIAIFVITAVISLPASANSLIDNPEAEAAVQRDEELENVFVDSATPARLKSPVKAFLFSAVVPGTGQFYSGARRGVLFAAAEFALWATYAVFHGQAEELKEGYLEFCDAHIAFEENSSTKSTKGWTLEDYEHATQSDNWHYVYTENNGKPVERVGRFYWADLPRDMIDEPGDKPLSESKSSFRIEAFGKRTETNDKFKQAKVFLGLMVVNHVISAVDGKIAATIYNNRRSFRSETNTRISFYPSISPSGHITANLALHKRF